MTDDIAIHSDRLWANLMTLAQIGRTPAGGCDRLALTDADAAARNLFRYWMEQAGLAVSVDPVGNMFGRREGREPGLAPVMLGSHLDTQSPGGKYDGILGVLAALECVRVLDERGIATRHAIEVVNWTNEEGARFAPGLLGAAVFTGQLPVAQAHAALDSEGRSLRSELVRTGFLGDAPLGRPVDSYFELHIEQGDRLQNAGKTIGVVEGTEVNAFVDIDCYGENAHAQATPMGQRVNALAAAAELITAIEAIGRAQAPLGCAGVASLRLWPNNRINIPHHVRFTWSGTHPDCMASTRAQIAQAAADIAERTRVRIEIEDAPDRPAAHFDPDLVSAVERNAERLGFDTMRLRSRAGHDAIRMAPYCPTAMIFVPCRDGISHSAYEDCTQADAAAGADVLLAAVLERAGTAS